MEPLIVSVVNELYREAIGFGCDSVLQMAVVRARVLQSNKAATEVRMIMIECLVYEVQNSFRLQDIVLTV